MKFTKLFFSCIAATVVLSFSVSAFAIGAGFGANGNVAPVTSPSQSSEEQAPTSETNIPKVTEPENKPKEYEKTPIDENAVIENGIFAGTVAVGGMTPSQAREAIADFHNKVMSSKLTFKKQASSHETTLIELGYSYDKEGAVERAALLGKYGPLIDRYKLLSDLKYDKVDLEVKYTPNEEELDEYMTKVVSSDDNPAQDATIKRSGNGFVTTHETSGEITDVDATKSVLNETLAKEPKIGMTIDVVSKGDEPRIHESDLTDIKDTLGSYSTGYGGSTADRKTNVKIATENINGYVLLPGDKFSASNTMKERNAENGYAMATEYIGTESVDSYGGGVCQVATTLYNAALLAELKVNQRSNHSMLVGYVEPSFDAAISWGNLDLILENDTGHTLYIEGTADGNNVSFAIYGTETRASNRTIKYESVVEERIVSESKIVEDPTKPADFEESKGSNHDYCKSHLVKKVYIDGKLTEEIKFSTDVYKASQKIVTKGTKAEEPEEPETETPQPETEAPQPETEITPIP